MTRFCVGFTNSSVDVYAATADKRLYIAQCEPPAVFNTANQPPLTKIACVRKCDPLLIVYLSIYPVIQKRSLYLPGSPLHLEWICGSVCIAFRKEYVMLHIDDGRGKKFLHLDA